MWAVCLGAFLFVRPAPWSAGFWLLLVPAFAAGVAYMVAAYRSSLRTMHEAQAWSARLRAAVDTLDVEDDGHLHEWFDAAQWERIFGELERMPKGSRSLRRAIEAVDPGFAR